MWSFLNRDNLNEKTALLEYSPINSSDEIKIDGEENNQEVSIQIDQNHFYALPDEIIDTLLSFFSIKNLAEIATIDKRFYQMIESHIPMIEIKDKEEIIHTRAPFLMFANNAGNQVPANYAYIRTILNDNYRHKKQLNHLESNDMAAKFCGSDMILGKKTSALVLPPLTCLAFMGLVLLLEIPLFDKFSKTGNLILSLITAAPPVGIFLISLMIGIVCFMQTKKIEKEKEKITAQIKPLPSLN